MFAKQPSVAALLLTVVCLAASPAQGAESSSVPPGYQLVWADEFDGPTLDMTEWTCRTGVSHQSCQRPENVSIDSGALRISLKKEAFGGREFTGGGAITRKTYQYGYFETRAKMFGGRGWHEAFWTSFIDNIPAKRTEYDLKQQRIEIDCFEQAAYEDMHTFTYGIIEWYPAHGSVSRDLAKVDADLSQDFHTYGFEVAPDYVNFYLDGSLLRSVDMRDVQWCPYYVWLSCIATKPDADPQGACWFDYLRIYTIDPKQYDDRKKSFVAKFEAEAGLTRSKGTDLWIEAERFPTKGGWTSSWQEEMCLRGHTGKDKVKSESDRCAKTQIRIPQAGEYTLWVRSRDYASGPAGRRTFRVAVGDRQSQGEFGAHGKDGWEWQKGDTFHLEKGPVAIDLIDTGAYYARCDKLLLTTDREFIPRGKGGRSNAEYH
jgi:hypothetical protein